MEVEYIKLITDMGLVGALIIAVIFLASGKVTSKKTIEDFMKKYDEFFLKVQADHTERVAIMEKDQQETVDKVCKSFDDAIRRITQSNIDNAKAMKDLVKILKKNGTNGSGDMY